jgi:hypothetical protein
MTTHGADEPRDACRLLAALIVGALQGRPKEEIHNGRFFESFIESTEALSPRIAQVAAGSFARKEPPDIRGSGYVVESLEAALWAFARSSSFREGALLAVNLGDDADTTGAVFGQLAGAYYGLSGIPREWVERLSHRALIDGFAAKLFDKATSPRGRRKHVLDLTSGTAVRRLNDILIAAGVRVAESGPIRPRGHRNPDESSLPDFVSLCRLDQHFTKTLGEWRVVQAPTWNLLSLLEGRERPGLLLVEAKASASDLNDDAEQAVAAAYLVASCGLDAVLLFLGFTGDVFYEEPFADAEAFAVRIREHLAPVVPAEVLGRRVPHKSGGSLTVIIGSLPVQEPSGQLSSNLVLRM